MSGQNVQIENRVVNMKIVLQDVLPASLPPPNANNTNNPNNINNQIVQPSPWTVIDSTDYSNPLYNNIEGPLSTEGTVVFGPMRRIIEEKKFVPSWLR